MKKIIAISIIGLLMISGANVSAKENSEEGNNTMNGAPTQSAAAANEYYAKKNLKENPSIISKPIGNVVGDNHTYGNYEATAKATVIGFAPFKAITENNAKHSLEIAPTAKASPKNKRVDNSDQPVVKTAFEESAGILLLLILGSAYLMINYKYRTKHTQVA
ncbi:MAG: hypothetical protein RR929_03765 [Erysipelotrichaceae bacterium]